MTMDNQLMSDLSEEPEKVIVLSDLKTGKVVAYLPVHSVENHSIITSLDGSKTMLVDRYNSYINQHRKENDYV